MMCREAEWKYLITRPYMKHVFKDSRGSWRCISFVKAKTKKSYHSQTEMAKNVNLQRASARAAASSRKHTTATGNGGSPEPSSHRWMFKSFSALYSKSQRRFRTKHKFCKLKNRLLRSNSVENRDPVSSSSLAELIPLADFDLDNLPLSSTDSDLDTTGVPPSRRSSDSLLSYTCESSAGPASTLSRSPTGFRAIKRRRRKRSVFRVAKLALSSSPRRGRERHQSPAPTPIAASSGIGRSRYTHGVAAMTEKPDMRNITRVLQTPENLSRGTSMTMDTSSSPCKSPSKSNSPSWQENYDNLVETLSVSSWSTNLPTDGTSHVMKRGGQHRLPAGIRSAHTLEQDSAAGIHIPYEFEQDWLHDRQQLLLMKRGSPLAPPLSPPLSPPISAEDLQRRQVSAINGALHTLPGKDFQEAIVDIILENDVQDLVDLEEFLQGYFRLNTLYQDIIQQFFNDLSSDIVHAQVSRAPSVFAQLASRSANKAKKSGPLPKSARRSTDSRY